MTSSLPLVTARTSNFDYDIPIMVEEEQESRMDGFVTPVGGLSSSGIYEFTLQPQGLSYLMLGNLALYAKCQIVNEDGSNLDDNDVVAPITGLGTTMWENVECIINDVTSSESSSSNMHYKSYVETLLSFENDAKDTHLKTQLFYNDTPRAYEDFSATGANAGFKTRYDLVKNSRVFDLYSPVHSDFTKSTKHLAPGNRLTLRFFKARDAFLLNSAVKENGSAKQYKLKVMDLRLYYTRITLRPDVKPPAIERYPVNKTIVKKFQVPSNMTQYTLPIQEGGPLPKAVILFQNYTSAVDGSYASNPLFLRHLNLNQLALRINGVQMPSAPLTPQFDTMPPLIAREYAHIFNNTGTWRTDRGNSISYPAFASGATVFPFDLSTDFCSGHHCHRYKNGTVTAELGWSKPLSKPATIFAYLSYEGVYTRKNQDLALTFEYL